MQDIVLLGKTVLCMIEIVMIRWLWVHSTCTCDLQEFGLCDVICQSFRLHDIVCSQWPTVHNSVSTERGPPMVSPPTPSC